MKSEILAILTKYKGILVSIYNNISHHKKYITAKTVENCFAYSDIAMSKKNIEYMTFRLFEYTHSLDHLEFLKLFEIFNEEPESDSYNSNEIIEE